MLKEQMIKAFESRTAQVGIIGLGYVGLPLMIEFVQSGISTLGFDIDTQKIDALAEGRSYIKHIPTPVLSKACAAGMRATTDFSAAAQMDALILCVPTPLDKYRQPDLTFVLDTVDSLLPHLRAGQIMVLESTTYPGTTDEELAPRLQAIGLIPGEDVFLAYSPEREDPGNVSFSTRTIPKVVGGHTAACTDVCMALYGHVIDTLVPVSSAAAAEMTKLLENIHRAVNIGLVNEMKVIADRMGIDIYEVIDAAATKPFGFVPYYPGPGLGGHCIPIDPFYLTWKAREFGLHTRFIELAGEVNSDMPSYVIDKVSLALNDVSRAIRGSKILVLGIAYKKNVDDMRESPSVELIDRLTALGADVSYSDPWVPKFPKMREYDFDLESQEIDPECLGNFDLVLVATDHDAFDYKMIGEYAKLIVDTRGRYRSHPKASVYRA